MDFQIKESYDIADLVKVMELLRSENGCPWDREQTHASIRKDLIEEAYETVEAIDYGSSKMLCEELGDLLMQVVFHSRIAQEQNEFDFDDVADGICKKLILRHPHVFGDVKVNGSEQVLANWDEIKKTEKGQTTATETLKSVPKVFPALMRSQKVQKRAAKAGFDYTDAEMAFGDLESEVAELKQAMEQKNSENCFEEVGDVLFSAVNVARMLGLDSEESLKASCDKFIDRFEKVEQLAIKNGVDMNSASLDSLNELWRKAKSAQS